MRIPPPNYTQTPNDLFDHWIPHLKESELKVLLVIIRKTFGWHKERDRISISQLERFTGLSEKSVLCAVKSLISKGVIKKQTIGERGKQQSFYELVVEDSNNSYPRKFEGGRPPEILGDTKETPSSKETTTTKPPPKKSRSSKPSESAVAEPQSGNKAKHPEPDSTKEKPRSIDPPVEALKAFIDKCDELQLPFSKHTLQSLALKNYQLLRAAVREFFDRSEQERKKIKTPDAWLTKRFKETEERERIFMDEIF